MRPIHFNDLTLKDKKLLIEDLGTLLCSIEHYDHRVYLYSMNTHYVEVYENIGSREIDRCTIAEYSDLDKYLSRISIYQYRNHGAY
jgi:hypothetical protein